MAKLTTKGETSAQKSSFRADIAGLRGVAVLLVLLCHFQIPGFGGGFIGPDIFFVISGYLITGLLVKEYAASIAARSRGRSDSAEAVNKSAKSRRGKISFSNFYLRRARRILPASILVLVSVNIYALVNLNILQSEQIKADSIWTLLFMANINFLRQATDYFAQSNAASPLQHYWTLSVEEQFYFVWPMLFIAATRLNGLKIFGQKLRWTARVRLSVGALTVSSLIWLVIEFTSDPTTAYFSSFSRAWELAFGGFLSLVSAEAFKARFGTKLPQVRLVAVILLVGSIAIVTPSNFGLTLIVPVLATGFVLITGEAVDGDLAYRALANRLFISIGAISYSLYLWHWPVFVFGEDLGLMETLPQRLFGVALCFVLGVISYKYIELFFLRIPLPVKKKISTRKSSKSAAAPALATVMVVSVIWMFTYSGIAIGKDGVQDKPWIPIAIASETPEASSGQGSDGKQNSEYVQQAVDVMKTGKQLATGKQIPGLLAGMADMHDMHGGWQCDQPQNRLYRCSLGSPSAKHVWVAAGDSHLEMWKTALRSLWKSQKDLRLELFIVVHCANSLDKSGIARGGSVEDKAACMPMHDLFLSRVSEMKPELVMLSDNTVPNNLVSQYGTGFSNMIEKLKPNAKNVLVIGQTPKYQILARCLNRQASNINSCGGTVSSIEIRRKMQQQVVRQAAVAFWDPVESLCLGNICPALLNNRLVSQDGTHINAYLLVDLSNLLMTKIDQILN